MKKSYLIIFVVLIIGVVSIFLFKDKINKDNTNKPPKEEVKNEEYYVYGIDKVIYNLMGISHITYLPCNYIFYLILISIVLCLISGLAPAKIASKKDPVISLRSE